MLLLFFPGTVAATAQSTNGGTAYSGAVAYGPQYIGPTLTSSGNPSLAEPVSFSIG